MKNIIRAALGATLTALCWSGGAQAQALTLNQALNPVGIQSAVLSPDGKHIAAIGFTGLNHGLLLIDSDTLATRDILDGRRVVEGNWSFNKEPRKVIWLTNDLLAVDYGIEAETVGLNGKKVADIGDKVLGKMERDNPDSPMALVFSDADSRDLAVVNGRTGSKNRLRYPMSGRLLDWAFDAQGQLRALTLSNSAFWHDTTTISNWYRPRDSQEWEKLAEFKVTDNYWTPLSVPDEDGKLIILSSIGRDTRAVFSYDTRRHEIGELLAGHPNQDVINVDGPKSDKFNVIVTNGMKPERYWLDRRWASAQASIDAALPKHINILSGTPDKLVLVYSYSDVDPGSWILVDMQKLKLKLVARAKPSIDPEQMRPMQITSYRARDGLVIPAYLTLPAATPAGGPFPTVILIHGGPMVRDHWRWNEEVQLLAAHGYAVFQPQFRGSSGFGRKFEEAGHGQWGLAMQDDVTDGVNYLIQRGLADPKRICIDGASYGGYAALWGLVKTPELYRCGVSFAGVSDIEYMFSDGSDSNDSKVAREMMRSQIGDAKLNQEQFDQVSPLKHADQIRAPLLLLHGVEDERVPISHSEKMMKALDRYHKTYEWQSFEREGHGLSYVNDQWIFYKKLFAFLDKYIGPPRPAATGAPKVPAQ